MIQNDNDRQKFIVAIIRARSEKGLTQAQLAELLGVHRSNISRLESGTHNPSLDFVIKVFEALGKNFEIAISERSDYMDYSLLCKKRDALQKITAKMSDTALLKFMTHFDILYTHDSTAIEGNTLSLLETKVVLEDGIAIGGKPMREIYEVVNHKKAFDYVKRCIEERKPLDESVMKDIHALLMEEILVGGVYRNVSVRITGAQHKPPAPSEMYVQVKNFFADLPYKYPGNAIELAAWTHAEFVKIHPFEDGNGRTSRLIMNYQLMANGFLPVSIAAKDRISYFETLERYAIDGDLEPFATMIAKLEEKRLDEWTHDMKEKNEKTDGAR